MGGRVIDLTLPRLGETMEQGRIVAWLKKPGDTIRRGETVLEVETDKTVVEVPALEDGVLLETLAEADDLVDVDAPIGRLQVANGAAAATPAPAPTAAVSPAAVSDRVVVDFLLPRLGETMEEGRIVAWLKKPGDAFRRGETVLEVETDKTVVEVPALMDGVLTEILAEPDEMVAIDRPVGRVEIARADAGPGPETAAPAATAVGSSATAAAPTAPIAVTRRAGEPLRASPVARRLARAAGIDLSALAGTGRRGRISGDDVRAALAGLQPSTADAVETRHGTIAVKRFAAAKGGAPVVLIHGLFGDADTFADLARRIAGKGRTVIGLDLPGHGRSVSEASAPDAVVEAITDAVRAVAPGRVRLVGHSYGAAIATRVALRLSGAVERLVLLAPAGLGSELEQSFVDGMLSARTPDALKRELLKLGADPKALSESWLSAQVEVLGRRNSTLRAIASGVVSGGFQQIDIAGDVAALAVPVSAVFGLSDGIIPWRHATALPARTAVHFVRDAGHMPHWTAADLVAALIDANGEGMAS